MAVIKPTRMKTPHDGSTFLWRWANLTEADQGEAVVGAPHNDKTVQVMGNFGAGGQVAIQGSLMPWGGSPVFVQLVDPQGNPISFGVAGIETVLENVYLIRPTVPAGTGVDVTVFLLMR